MDNSNTRSACGCLTVLFIAPLVGLALRAGDWKHFWVMAGIFVLVWLLGAFALYNLAESNSLQKLFGLGAIVLAIAGLIAVGSFLLTGKYENSLKYVSWLWQWRSAGQVEQPVANAPPTAQVKPTPTTVASVDNSTSADAELERWGWLIDARLSNDQVLNGLNEIWSLAPGEAKQIADALQKAELATLPETNRQATELLAAVALERAGSVQEAYALYKQVADRNPQDPYAASASVRLHFVIGTTVKPGGKPNAWTDRKDEANTKLVKRKTFIDAQNANTLHEPERAGWFLISNQWAWSTSRQSAIQVLSNTWSGQFSYEVVQFLRSISPFHPQYSFMFVLLVLAVGIKVLALPLYVRNTRLAEYMRRDGLVVRYTLLVEPQSRRTMLINVYAVTVVEIIFIIWMLNAIQQSTVQWAVDGARFLWVEDVTERNFWILVAWVCIYTTSWLITGEQRVLNQVQYGVSELSCDQVAGSLQWFVIFGIAWAIMAWQANWPSALFIFWTTLLISGVLLTLVLRAIWRTVIIFQNR